MQEHENAQLPEDYVWEVETSAPQDDVVESVAEVNKGHVTTTSNTTGYVSLLATFLTFTLPAFLEPWSLAIPVGIAIFGLVWSWRKRKTSPHAGLIGSILAVILVMTGAGFVAMNVIPEEAWTDVFSVLFYVGGAFLLCSLIGVTVLLSKRKGKRRTA
jgi:hypothetical protein